MNVLFAFAALGASLASAQLDAWRTLREEELHTRSFAHYAGNPDELLAPCDKSGRLRLPPRYDADYSLTERDRQFFEGTLSAVKPYASIQAALDAGYLPVKGGFVQGVGLSLAHPERLQDGTYAFERPDILHYIKKSGAPLFRLVGFAYVAGEKRVGKMKNLDFSRKSRKKSAVSGTPGGWGSRKDLCVIVEPGRSVSMLDRSQMPGNCRGGKLYPQLFGTYTWLLVYNPNGMFSEKNPMIDFLDRDQKLTALCPKVSSAPR